MTYNIRSYLKGKDMIVAGDPFKADDDFFEFVLKHSKTDLHLFSRDHASRLLKLAGSELPLSAQNKPMIAISHDMAQRLIEKARSRKKAP